MGRSLTGAFGSGTIAQGVFKLKAGATISQNDLVVMGPSGLVTPGKNTDILAVANVGSTIFTPVQAASISFDFYGHRQPLLVDPETGHRWLAVPNTAASGLILQRYSSAGALLASKVVNGSGSNVNSPKLQLLSNGNILLTFVLGTVPGTLTFAIYDSAFNEIKAPTSVEAVSDYYYYDAIPLSGGGFACSYEANGGTNQRFASYDNAGTVVVAATTLKTWAGTAGILSTRMAQLSDGNILIACNSATSVDVGYFHGIFTLAGAAVMAFTNLDAVQYSNVMPEISVRAGYYILACATTGTNIQVRVFDNSGAIQGPVNSITTANAGAGVNDFKIVTDGVAFYVLYQPSALFWYIAKILTTGALSTTYIGGTVGDNGGDSGVKVDAIYENGRIIALHMYGAVSPSARYFVFNLQTSLLETDSTLIASGYTDGAILPGGDYSILTLTNNATGPYLYSAKYANTSIMGVAQSAAVADALVGIAGLAGAYSVNPLTGTPSKAFDHSTANVLGNRGVLLSNGAILKGF